MNRPLHRDYSTNLPATDKSASLLILNWNGKDLLAECLPSVITAVETNGGDHEIIVLDNGSTDGSIQFLADHFPQVKVVPLDKNYSFIGGYNRGIPYASKDIIVLLNNDMFVDPHFLRPLLDGFSDEDVFAVSSQIFFHDPNKRREETGKTRALWRHGVIDYAHDLPTDGDLKNRYVPAFWLGGGSAAVDRRKFLEIGGFDTLFSPLYMEDVDLSYQAWKRGWKIFFCPESKVIHKHRSSSSRMDRAVLERIIARNRLLFIWKNVTDLGMLAEHLAFLPFMPLRMSWTLRPKDTVLVFLMALARLPQVLLRRIRLLNRYRRSDREVFRLANSMLEYKEKYAPLTQVREGERLNVLFVCPYFPALYHGGGVRMYQMIQHLSRDHDVTLLTFWENEKDRRYFADMEQICKRVVKIKRVSTVNSGNFWRILPPAIAIDFGDPAFGQALQDLLAEEDFQIVQVEFVQMAFQVPALRREGLLLTEHEVQHAAWLNRLNREKNPAEKVHLLFQWMRWLNAELSLSRKFDRVAALTEEDAWSLTRYDPALPVDVIHTGVDTGYYSPSACEPEPNSLMFVGNFHHPPNVDSALFLVNEIMPLVWREKPGAKLYIIGPEVPPEIQRLEQPDRVVVTGWVEDLRPYMDRTKLFVVPIRLGVGMRNKILEAWAMEQAVITTPLGSAGFSARHGENIWIAETAQEFAGGILHLLNDPELLAKLGKEGRKCVETERSWQAAVAKQVNSYVEVLKQKGIMVPGEGIEKAGVGAAVDAQDREAAQ